MHLRIDTIEQALREGGGSVVGPEGYIVAYRVASDNLRLGLSVVADSVNPIAITRQAWREVAVNAGVLFTEIEVVCSDRAEHRRRGEERQATVVGLKLPTWADVVARDYEPWTGDRLQIDTAGQTPDESKKALARLLGL